METPMRNTHPMILVAATSVTLVSLAGLASIAGWLPANHGAPSAPLAPVAQVAMAPQAMPAVIPSIPASTEKTATLNIPAGSSITVNPVNTGDHRPAKQAAAPRKVAAPAPVAVEASPNLTYRGANPVPPPAANTPVNDSGIYVENSRQTQNVCRDCGTVESIREMAQEGQGTGLGAVAGTLLGGVLGHQVGNGRGRDVATVVGALGGAYAGHEVEKNARGSRQYQITVRLDDGSLRTVTETQQPMWHSGDRVRVSNNHIASL